MITKPGAGLAKKHPDGVKVLTGKLSKKKLTVKAEKFSKTAQSAIEAAGGKSRGFNMMMLFCQLV